MEQQDLEKKLNELRIYTERLDERIKTLENNKEIVKPKENKNIIDTYEILKVNKLYASLPIYTSARSGIILDGEIWITDIGGTRKINVMISGTTYSSTIT